MYRSCRHPSAGPAAAEIVHRDPGCREPIDGAGWVTHCMRTDCQERAKGKDACMSAGDHMRNRAAKALAAVCLALTQSTAFAQASPAANLLLDEAKAAL